MKKYNHFSLKNRITIRILIYLLFLSAVFAVIFAVFHAHSDYKNKLELKTKQLKFIESSYANPIAKNAYDLDFEKLKIIAKGILKTHEITYLKITEYSPDGNNPIRLLLEKGTKGDIAHVFNIKYNEFVPDAKQFVQVELNANIESFATYLAQYIGSYLINAIVITLILAVLVYLTIHTFIIKHILSVAKYFEKFDVNNPEILFRLKRPKMFRCSNDEIGRLEESINEMRMKILDFKEESINSAQLLEEKNAELIKAKEVLEQSESRFKSLSEMLPETIFEANEKIELVYMNKKGLERFGYEKSTDIESLYVLIHSEDQRRFENFINNSLEDASENIVVNCISNEGDIFPAIIYISAISILDNFLGLRGIIAEITDFRKAEGLKNDIKLAKRTAEIKHQLLANISHEMRTPMNAIIGMANFLKDTELNSQQEEYLNTILNASGNLLNIINDVLTLTKLEKGKMILNNETLNIQEFFYDIAQLFKSQLLAKNLTYKYNIDNSFPKNIEIDKKQFKQITHNLISNAIKYTSVGTINVNLILLNSNNNEIIGKFEVEDTGIGIKSEHLDKIFEPFSRVEDDIYAKYVEGTGLGLAISKKLAEMLGGKLDVTSSLGIGSKFWFTFNAKMKIVNQLNNSKKQIPRIENMAIKVLLAEDKKVNQQVAKIILEKNGCSVEIANNGMEVLEKYEDSKYDVILMDIMMPLLNGIEAMKELRKKYEKLPPIIGLSAHAMEGDARRFIEMGLDDYLEKPINRERMIEKIYYWVNRK